MISTFRTQATNASTTANYADVAYDTFALQRDVATLTIESNNK